MGSEPEQNSEVPVGEGKKSLSGFEQAELRRLTTESERNEAERRKLEAEALEINGRIAQPWWQFRLTTVFQAVIGGIVAGALLWGFVLDHFLKISDMIEKEQAALEQEISVQSARIQRDREVNATQQEHLKLQLAALAQTNKELENQIQGTETRLREELSQLQSKLAQASVLLRDQQSLPREELEGLKAKKESTEKQLGVLEAEIAQLAEAASDAHSRSAAIQTQLTENKLRGLWVNVDPATRGITKLDIRVRANQLIIQAWGKCHPRDCDWGKEVLLVGDNSSAKVSWNQGFAVKEMTLVIEAPDRLVVDIESVYKDARGLRSSTYAFNKTQ